MQDKRIEWGKEIIQAASDATSLANHAGIPGIGLLARFAQIFYEKHLQKRFEVFLSAAEIDDEMIRRVCDDENYSNHLYAALETVRQTHAKVGIIALALIYKDHWDDGDYLMAAMRAFSQISDKTIDAFISLYESIPAGQDYLMLKIPIDGEIHFHDLYSEAVELISRNFFVLSTSSTVHANGPIQGMKWDHTDSFYKYCQAAKTRS